MEQLKNGTNPENLVYLPDAGWHTNLTSFQGARTDHARIEHLICCSPRESVSFNDLGN